MNELPKLNNCPKCGGQVRFRFLDYFNDPKHSGLWWIGCCGKQVRYAEYRDDTDDELFWRKLGVANTWNIYASLKPDVVLPGDVTLSMAKAFCEAAGVNQPMSLWAFQAGFDAMVNQHKKDSGK